MSPFGALVFAGLRSNFGLALLKHRLFTERKERWRVPLLLLVGVSFAILLTQYVNMLRGVYGALAAMGQEHVMLTLALLAGQALILVFGFVYVIGAFYFAKDLEFLVTLPLRPYHVVLAKYLTVLVNEYITTAPVVVPPLVVYGVLAGAGPGYWLMTLPVYALLPVLPLSIVSVFVMGVMRVVNLGRRKDALIIAGSLALIGMTFALQYGLARMAGSADPQAVLRVFTEKNGLIALVGARFPPSVWATNALMQPASIEGLASLALIAVVSLVVFALIVLLAELLFYRGLIGLAESSRPAVTLTAGDVRRLSDGGTSPTLAIFRREWRVMQRTPMFLLNGMLTTLIVPAVFLVMFKTGSAQGAAGPLAFLAAANPLHAALAAACFMIVAGSMNGTASSSFSREGAQFWISKVIPVPPRAQVAAKFLHSYAVALIGILAATLVTWFAFHLAPRVLAAALPIALLATFVITAIGLAIDVSRPLLDWTNPQKAIKQNLNVLIATLAGMAFVVLVVLAALWLARLGLPPRGALVTVVVALVLAAAIAWRLLVRHAERRYDRIEV